MAGGRPEAGRRTGWVGLSAIALVACSGAEDHTPDDPASCTDREGCTNLEEALWFAMGPPYNSFGHHIGFAGDLNDDGHGDVAVASE
jgi:hypothetical protein